MIEKNAVGVPDSLFSFCEFGGGMVFLDNLTTCLQQLLGPVYQFCTKSKFTLVLLRN